MTTPMVSMTQARPVLKQFQMDRLLSIGLVHPIKLDHPLIHPKQGLVPQRLDAPHLINMDHPLIRYSQGLQVQKAPC